MVRLTCLSKPRTFFLLLFAHRKWVNFPTEINIPAAQSTAVSSIQAALDAAQVIGYPIILRSAFSLGGLGSGFAHDEEELRNLAAKSLSLSPQVLIEKSLKGWKEVEYEVVRDGADVSTDWRGWNCWICD